MKHHVRRRLLSFSEGLSFVRRQQRDWVVTVVRSSMDKLDYQMVFPYLSIYIVALGATATQLGIVNSLGMTVAGILSPLTGWFIDRAGPKRIYLLSVPDAYPARDSVWPCLRFSTFAIT